MKYNELKEGDKFIVIREKEYKRAEVYIKEKYGYSSLKDDSYFRRDYHGNTQVELLNDD